MVDESSVRMATPDPVDPESFAPSCSNTGNLLDCFKRLWVVPRGYQLGFRVDEWCSKP